MNGNIDKSSSPSEQSEDSSSESSDDDIDLNNGVDEVRDDAPECTNTAEAHG